MVYLRYRLEVAQRLCRGWQIGMGQTQSVSKISANRPERMKFQSLDVTQNSAGKLDALIHQLGGMDLFLLSSGSFQNMV